MSLQRAIRITYVRDKGEMRGGASGLGFNGRDASTNAVIARAQRMHLLNVHYEGLMLWRRVGGVDERLIERGYMRRILKLSLGN